MSLAPGVYTIRWPEPDHKGWVASARDIDDSLYGEALPLSNNLLQKWRVIRLQGAGNVYLILKEGEVGPPGGFGIEKASNGAPVRFKTQPSVWNITKKNNEDTYTISLIGTGDSSLSIALINPWGLGVRRLTLHSHCESCAHEAFGWVFDPVVEKETTEGTAEENPASKGTA